MVVVYDGVCRKSEKEMVDYREVRRKHEEEGYKTGGKDFAVKINPCILCQ